MTDIAVDIETIDKPLHVWVEYSGKSISNLDEIIEGSMKHAGYILGNAGYDSKKQVSDLHFHLNINIEEWERCEKEEGCQNLYRVKGTDCIFPQDKT